MSEKKCRVCGANAEWELDGEFYCEDCMCTKFNVTFQDMPLVCEMCCTPIYRDYFLDGEDHPFCSPECALKYNGAERLEEDDNE